MTNQTLKAIRKIKAEIRQAKIEYGVGWQDHFSTIFLGNCPAEEAKQYYKI